MTRGDAADLARRLEEGGFAIFEGDPDTIALRRDTETFRRKNAADAQAAS
jgi:hypothetical protein